MEVKRGEFVVDLSALRLTRFVVNFAVESSSKLPQFNKMTDCLK